MTRTRIIHESPPTCSICGEENVAHANALGCVEYLRNKNHALLMLVKEWAKRLWTVYEEMDLRALR